MDLAIYRTFALERARSAPAHAHDIERKGLTSGPKTNFVCCNSSVTTWLRIMHLMYYLDGDGKRVYTLKVQSWVYTSIVCSVSVSVLLIGTQKLDPSGRPTMSAHPGECFLL